MKKTTAKKENTKKSKAVASSRKTKKVTVASPRKTKKVAVAKGVKKVVKQGKKATKKKAPTRAAKTSKSPSKVKTIKTSKVKTSAKTKVKIKPVKSEKKTRLIKQIKTHKAKRGIKISKSELNRLKEELLAERTRVIRELDNLDDITHTNGNDDVVEVHAYSIHMAENASDIEAVNTALGLRKILIERLTQINHALERLNEGSYGICLRCGCAINMERLLAKPQATLCVECRRIVEAEKRGVI